MSLTNRHIVKGHWRKMYQPHTGEYTQVWVDQHLKGPDDAPLVIRETTICGGIYGEEQLRAASEAYTEAIRVQESEKPEDPAEDDSDPS